MAKSLEQSFIDLIAGQNDGASFQKEATALLRADLALWSRIRNPIEKRVLLRFDVEEKKILNLIVESPQTLPPESKEVEDPIKQSSTQPAPEAQAPAAPLSAAVKESENDRRNISRPSALKITDAEIANG